MLLYTNVDHMTFYNHHFDQHRLLIKDTTYNVYHYGNYGNYVSMDYRFVTIISSCHNMVTKVLALMNTKHNINFMLHAPWHYAFTMQCMHV